MSVIVTEKQESRRLTASVEGKASSLDLFFNVQGTDSETAAKVAVDALAPAIWGSGSPLFYKQSVTVEPIGHQVWVGTVHYDTSKPEPLSADDSFEFDTTGGSQHITQSLATQGSYPGGAPDYQGAIGVSDNGVDGVDITVPVLKFSETHFFEELSPAYKLALVNLTGTINSATFRGLAAGEVLFLGASARRQDNRHSTPWSVTYQFASQSNRSNFNVGSIAVAAKRGWDYMWIRYGLVDDGSSNSLLRVPTSVHVERVYPDGDFSVLGIGV